VDFEPSDDQREIAEAVEALLARHAGASRAIELAAKDDYDFELERALEDAGFLDLASGEGTGPLEAALLVEAAARHAAVAAVAGRALVAPALALDARGGVALAGSEDAAPIRYGAHAHTLVFCDGDVARVVRVEPGDVAPVRSSFGYPMGRVREGLAARGEPLAPGSAAVLRRWWRVALAAEAAGSMRAALDLTVDYLKQRRQFGRPIAAFQAVQHRLAECHVHVEGARWLAREAAWQGAPAEAAALAAAHALAAAGRVFAETHQLSGATGYTREHDLHVHSMRLQALRLELGGVGAQRRAPAAARFAGPA